MNRFSATLTCPSSSPQTELGTTAPDGALALSLRERSIVQFWTLRGHVSGFLDLSEALERFQPIHETCLSCITTSATHFDFVEQNTVPLRALWEVIWIGMLGPSWGDTLPDSSRIWRQMLFPFRPLQRF